MHPTSNLSYPTATSGIFNRHSDSSKFVLNDVKLAESNSGIYICRLLFLGPCYFRYCVAIEHNSPYYIQGEELGTCIYYLYIYIILLSQISDIDYFIYCNC